MRRLPMTNCFESEVYHRGDEPLAGTGNHDRDNREEKPAASRRARLLQQAVAVRDERGADLVAKSPRLFDLEARWGAEDRGNRSGAFRLSVWRDAAGWGQIGQREAVAVQQRCSNRARVAAGGSEADFWASAGRRKGRPDNNWERLGRIQETTLAWFSRDRLVSGSGR